MSSSGVITEQIEPTVEHVMVKEEHEVQIPETDDIEDLIPAVTVMKEPVELKKGVEVFRSQSFAAIDSHLCAQSQERKNLGEEEVEVQPFARVDVMALEEEEQEDLAATVKGKKNPLKICNAERQKLYRERKKARLAALSGQTERTYSKSNAQRQKELRELRKDPKAAHPRRKTNAEKQKEYRERKKLKYLQMSREFIMVMPPNSKPHFS